MSRGTIVIDFWRCEWENARELKITEEAWEFLIEAIEYGGFKVEAREMPAPIPFEPDIHRTRRVLNAVHEIQGEKWIEGTSSIPAIESLVAKYAELK